MPLFGAMEHARDSTQSSDSRIAMTKTVMSDKISKSLDANAQDTNAQALQATDAWTVDGVVQWMQEHGASQATVNTARDQEIDGKALLLLTAEDMSTVLKVEKAGERVKLAGALRSLQMAQQPPSYS
ncbi:UNVERIFIED_CONTAM: hypothetical protein HDU68_010945 [Siphonaria sp. JEL0065]|nr:hypothetical protein HDU68_010945 [Siphonaria sp. JEL0065]